MNTKKLIINLLSKKAKDIDEVLEVFELIIEFARDVAKELFATQQNKRFLVDKVDDIAHIVDNNMQKNKVKIHQKLVKKFDKNDAESTIAWLIDRWINTFVNLTTNTNYRDYFDLSNIVRYEDNLMFAYEENEDYFADDIEKFSESEIKKALKFAWEDALFDSDFDVQDFEELCAKYNFSACEILAYDLKNKIKAKIEINTNQHQQMMFDF